MEIRIQRGGREGGMDIETEVRDADGKMSLYELQRQRERR